MYICIFEDSRYRNFLPLVFLRPVFDLRCGVFTLREKVQRLFPRVPLHLHCRTELADVVREQNTGTSVNTLPEDDCWFINGRLIANENLSDCVRRNPRSSAVFMSDGRPALAFVEKSHVRRIAGRLNDGLFAEDTFADLPVKNFNGQLVEYPWELILHSPEEIENDFRNARRGLNPPAAHSHRGAHFVDRRKIMLGSGSAVKPGAVLDAEHGPVIIGKRVTVMSNAVIQGPAYVGDDTIVKVGAKLYHGTSVGRRCKVGGEVEMSVIQSFSNKQHDGYLGHSYLGSWVNIGADTNTSDLKNNYGTVKVDVGQAVIDSGTQFLGMLMGDHSKSGINMMFNAGTVVGVSCNLFGAGLPMKFIPSFSWGGAESFSEYAFEKSLETARNMMKRRDVLLSDAEAQLLALVFERTRDDRKRLGFG